jgi:hypothetical protein
VQKEDAWPALDLEACLQNVHREPIHVVDNAVTDAWSKRAIIVIFDAFVLQFPALVQPFPSRFGLIWV